MIYFSGEISSENLNCTDLALNDPNGTKDNPSDLNIGNILSSRVSTSQPHWK
jgi:hypothetical protein